MTSAPFTDPGWVVEVMVVGRRHRRVWEIIREMEDFIEEQKRYHAFGKYSYPVLRKLIDELKEAVRRECRPPTKN